MKPKALGLLRKLSELWIGWRRVQPSDGLPNPERRFPPQSQSLRLYKNMTTDVGPFRRIEI